MNNNVSYRQVQRDGTASPFSFSPVGVDGADAAGHHCLDRRDAGRGPAGRRKRWCRDRRLQGDESVTGRLALRVRDLQPEPRSRHPVLQPAQASRRHLEQRRVPRASAAPGVDRRWNGRKHGVQQHALGADGGRRAWSPGARRRWPQNPNANAVRWGTLYNIRFDSNRPPVMRAATIGFFKTGAPMDIGAGCSARAATTPVPGPTLVEPRQFARSQCPPWLPVVGTSGSTRRTR